MYIEQFWEEMEKYSSVSLLKRIAYNMTVEAYKCKQWWNMCALGNE